MDRAPWVIERFMSGWKGLNRVEHVLLMKVILVGHQHHAHKTTRAAESFFPAGIQKLVERYNKCIVLQGDYLEKWYVKLLTVTSIKAVKCILPLLFDSRNEILSPPSWKFYLLYIEDKELSHRKLKYKNYELSREYLDYCQCFYQPLFKKRNKNCK